MEQLPLLLTKELHIQRIDHLAYLHKGSLDLSQIKEHRGYGLLYIKKGKLQVIGDNETYLLEKNDFLLLKTEENVMTREVGSTQVELLIVVFYAQHTSLEKLIGKLLKLTQKEQELILSFIFEARVFQKKNNFLHEEADPPLSPNLFANEQMLFLSLEYFFIHLIRRLEMPWQIVKPKGIEEKSSYPQALELILDYLSLHLNEYLSLEQICIDNGMSQTKVQHLFKSEFNTGVIHHFMKMKIDMAKALLEIGEMNFTQISDQLGYSSIHYFSRQFKKVTGMTPTAYLEQVKKSR